jgi:hypothetical protein
VKEEKKINIPLLPVARMKAAILPERKKKYSIKLIDFMEAEIQNNNIVNLDK